MKKIAVYGTLKTGFGNNRCMGDSKLIGPGKTEGKHVLLASGIPFLIKDGKGYDEEFHTHVSVEVFEVSEDQMPSVDGLEGHREGKTKEDGGYLREFCNIVMEDGEVLECEIYFYYSDATRFSRTQIIKDGIYTNSY